jgi:hypothetical protein
VTEPAPNTELRPGSNPRAISLRLVILFITCLAIALGLIWHWPGVSPIAVVGLVIAAVRSWSMMRGTDIKEGLRKSWGLAFIGSLGVVTLTAVAASGAFVAVCFPLGASQFQLYDPPPIQRILFGTAFVLGGTAGAIAAALVLDQMWLKPLADRARIRRLATLKERTCSLFQTAIPPLAAIMTGGICSLAPATIAVFSGALQPLLYLAAFLACITAFVGGGCLGILAASYSIIGTAAFVGFVLGAVASSLFLLLLDQIPALAQMEPPGRVLLAGITGTGAGAVTALVARWSQKPD